MQGGAEASANQVGAPAVGTRLGGFSMARSSFRWIALCGIFAMGGGLAMAGPADSPADNGYLSPGTDVKVIDDGKLFGNIVGLRLDHGVDVAHEFKCGFTMDGIQGTVIIFDVNMLKRVGQVALTAETDCVIYDPASKHVFVMAGDSHSATVIDPQTGTVIKSIDLGGRPEFAVADDMGNIYANLKDQKEVIVVDSQTLRVTSRWPVAPAGMPTALAIDPEHRRLFIAGRDPQMFVVMDAVDGKVIESFPISAGADAAAYEPETGTVFVSTSARTIDVFHEDSPDKFSVVGIISTGRGAKAAGLDAQAHHVIFADTADVPAPAIEPERPLPMPVMGTSRVLVGQ
jgi:YVTN family beta-propeller protein